MKLHNSLLEKLVDSHYANLFRFALSLAGNEAEAADLTQQTFLLLATKGGQIREIVKAKSWLFTTLRREFYSMRQKSNRMVVIDEHEQNQIEAPENVELDYFKRANAIQVQEALAEVREVFRQPLALFYFEEFSYRDIAEILEIPEGTVMSRLARGREELRQILSRKIHFEGLADNIIPIRHSSDGTKRSHTS